MSESIVDWSALQTELLEKIYNHLTFDPDCIRFRSVCPLWRAAAPKRPQSPWIIGHRRNDDGNHTLLSFHHLSSDGQISPILDLPESSIFGGMPCRGSSHGWLALLDIPRLSILLWNPLTRSKIQLPRLTVHEGWGHMAHMYSSSAQAQRLKENERDAIAFRETEHYLVRRVILSADPGLTSDYVALADCSGDHAALYRAGDCAWTTLPGGFNGAAFYGGRFYVSVYGEVYVCEFGQGPNKRVEKKMILSARWKWDMDESHLVVSGGDLLLVLVYWYGLGSKGDYLFSVRKVDLAKMELVTLKSLGDRALFVGRNHSFSVVASRVPGCKSNAIYCTVSRFDPYIEIPNKIKVYDLKDEGKDESNVFVPSDAAHPHADWKPCVWFAPSLLSQNPGSSD